MPESALPPVYIKKEHKRLKLEPGTVGKFFLFKSTLGSFIIFLGLLHCSMSCRNGEIVIKRLSNSNLKNKCQTLLMMKDNNKVHQTPRPSLPRCQCHINSTDHSLLNCPAFTQHVTGPLFHHTKLPWRTNHLLLSALWSQWGSCKGSPRGSKEWYVVYCQHSNFQADPVMGLVVCVDLKSYDVRMLCVPHAHYLIDLHLLL